MKKSNRTIQELVKLHGRTCGVKGGMNTDYNLTKEAARELTLMSIGPADYRLELLQKYAETHGVPATMELFVEFMGLANAVAENCQEAVKQFLMKHHGYDANKAASVNLPTIHGALNGIGIARDAPGQCDDCAFRHGSAPNQSLTTTLQAESCVNGPFDPLLCHHRLKKRGKNRECRGFQAAVTEAQKR